MLTSFVSTALLISCTLASHQEPTATQATQATQGTEGREGTEALRVMSFNIRYGTARDGANHWKLRRKMVIDTISDTRPHILGVQEALSFQLDELASSLPGYTRVGVGRDGGDAGEFSCIYVASSRLRITRSGTFWLSETPGVVGSKGWDAALPRICSWAVLHDRVTKAHFVHFNTHFDHRGKQARERSSHLIASRFRHFPGLPVLVTGDLNSGEHSLALEALKGDTLHDTFRVRHPDTNSVGTFNGFRGRKDGAKIDFVLASKQWQVITATIDRRESDGRTPSDHYPVTATVRLRSWKPPALMPTVQGKPWKITGPVDLGKLQGKKQEAVDHAIFRSNDGKWNLWSCIRGTKIGRLLYAWRSDTLQQHLWQAEGIAMRAQSKAGESIDGWGGKEWIQAPHVVNQEGIAHMLFGGHTTETGEGQICLTTSADGRTFKRHRNARGQSRVFTGPGEARDPMTIKIDGRWYCYYSGHDKGSRAPCKIYARTSEDLVSWSEPIEVCWGGSAGHGKWSAECPFVVAHDGAYYLFRTTSYKAPLTHVYRSTNPLDFGRDNDRKKIGTIAVAAPEIVLHEGGYFISSVHDLARGIQLARLSFILENDAQTSLAFERRFKPLWSFEDGTLSGWVAQGDAFANQPTFSNSATVREQAVGHEGQYFIGTYEDRPNQEKPEGGSQGDAPTGTLRSPEFVLPNGHISFLIGGGRNASTLYVALVTSASGHEVRRATGSNSNHMQRVVWDVSALAGQQARVIVVDRSSSSWGHINCDDFRIAERKGPASQK